MRRMRIKLGGLALAASVALAAGCNNGPPGGGLTNGTGPDLTADKQSIRTDELNRSRTDRGEMRGAAGISGSDAGETGSGKGASGVMSADGGAGAGAPTRAGGTSSGTGGKGGNSGEAPAKETTVRTGAARKDTVEAVGEASSQPPSTKDGTAPGSAAGGTKPAGDIKVGTPRSPQ